MCANATFEIKQCKHLHLKCKYQDLNIHLSRYLNLFFGLFCGFRAGAEPCYEPFYK